MEKDEQERLDKIADQLCRIADTHAHFADQYGSKIAAADAAAHRRAAEIIRQQIECEVAA